VEPHARLGYDVPMKSLHRPDLYTWSSFDAERNVDFNSVLWVRPGGNVVVDPLPLSEHDRKHLAELGGAAWIVITNSDHVRASAELRESTGAQLAGPAAEKAAFPIACDRWLEGGEELVPRLRVLALEGSKTPGELALVLEETTLVTGDLVRAHRAGALMMLPAAKLADPLAATRSVAALADLPKIEAVLVGDGWSLFSGGHAALRSLAAY
jgi:glyoxylase-like metal-dependent hydrolase (beta-lactamase superfamily II)